MSLIKNSTWNLLGTAASAAVMIPAMGFFARTLDAESFGLLTLVLALIGYASVLDGSFARAVVREIAVLSSDDVAHAKISGTALRVVLGFGGLGALIFYSVVPWIVEIIHVTPSIHADAVNGFRLASVMVPIILSTMVWLASLEGLNRFAELNLIRAIGFSLMFGVSVLAVSITPSFVSAVLGLLVGRLLMAVLSGWASSRLIGRYFGVFDRAAFQSLYRFGGWLTVSNIVTPLLDYLDRFVLSATGGASSIAYYAAPADAMQKMQALPGAVARALFPMLSRRDGRGQSQLMLTALLIQALIGLGVAIVLIGWGDFIIALWLGSNFVEASSMVLKVLAIGFLFNTIAWVPQTALQAMGFAKETAFISLGQVVPYVVLLIALTSAFGLVGAALASATRALVDLCLLGWICRQSMLKLAKAGA